MILTALLCQSAEIRITDRVQGPQHTDALVKRCKAELCRPR